MHSSNPFSILSTLDSNLGKLSFTSSPPKPLYSKHDLGTERLLVVNVLVFNKIPATAMINSGASG